jgi:hypothetical protein
VPAKHKALSSNPSTAKCQERKEGERERERGRGEERGEREREKERERERERETETGSEESVNIYTIGVIERKMYLTKYCYLGYTKNP